MRSLQISCARPPPRMSGLPCMS
uniref:Uncharacterized protein n=1 Tax=Arundo donax TaxID=35708 RepID=A0A0A8ZC77_ARUDO